MKPIIGILGGLGPRATVEFEKILLDKLDGNDQQLPTIITINDGSVPDRTSYLLQGGPDPAPRLMANLNKLKRAGASFACMPCNTAFAPAIFNRLRDFSEIPIINLPHEVEKLIQNLGLKKVLILATEGTIKTKIYQNVCKSSGIEYLVPDEPIQAATSQIIKLIKSNDYDNINLYAQKIKYYALENNVDGIILGCTELPLIESLLVPRNCQSINTLEVLADAAIIYCNQSMGNLRSSNVTR